MGQMAEMAKKDMAAFKIPVFFIFKINLSFVT
jgi:hypothetical protein